jgi:hypothetical protein
MPEFVLVRCCDCEMWQVTQRRKSQGKLQISKWECKLCGKKQSVGSVAGTAQQAAELRPLCQELNLRKRDAPTKDEQVQEERVAVFVPFSSDWDALLSESSSSEEGEAMLMFRDRQLPPKRKRESVAKTSKTKKRVLAEEKAIDDGGFAKPLPPQHQQQQQQQQQQQLLENDDDGLMFSRDDNRSFVAVADEEVWKDPDDE